MKITTFIDQHFLHFNAASLRDAACGYKAHVEKGGKMLVTLAGAMSTAELGKSLSAMIREGKVHAICCTGANLEEDLFNLVAHNHYKRVPHYRNLTPQDEKKLFESHYNRVTDTCIPEEEAMRKIEKALFPLWKKATQERKSFLPHCFLEQLILGGHLEDEYQIDPTTSWLWEACQHNIPLFVPGWEDSTLGNFLAARSIQGEISPTIVKSGIYYMLALKEWYLKHAKGTGIGFFQIGGGIAGDFPVCVVPMITQDLKKENTQLWQYFCQISDARASYGSYSGAPPSEKITWGKLDVDTPSYIIESDATIVAPLLFAYVLGW